MLLDVLAPARPGRDLSRQPGGYSIHLTSISLIAVRRIKRPTSTLANSFLSTSLDCAAQATVDGFRALSYTNPRRSGGAG